MLITVNTMPQVESAILRLKPLGELETETKKVYYIVYVTMLSNTTNLHKGEEFQ